MIIIALRFGLIEESAPHYLGINKRHGDLGLGIEIPIEEMRKASDEGLKKMFKTAALRALIHAGEKYERPVTALKAELAAIESESPPED